MAGAEWHGRQLKQGVGGRCLPVRRMGSIITFLATDKALEYVDNACREQWTKAVTEQ
jgi:hypothetical protein